MTDIYDALRGRDLNSLTHRDLFELVLIILIKPGPERDQKEIEILVKYVENMEFLDKLKAEKSVETLTNLCKHFEYERFDKDQIVFEEGSLGTKFYIILQGRVEVLIKSNNTFSSSLYMPIGELSSGKAFGELAIMDDALKPRKATIKCVDTTHFAVLSRKSFQSFLGHLKKEFEAQIEALTANALFSRSKWSNRLIEQWVKSFTPIGNPQRNNVIYHEGDSSDYLYFIRSGQVVNTKKMEINRPYDIQKDIILDERNQIFQVDHAKMMKEVEIAVWGEGSLFGEEEAFQVFKHERHLEKERDRFKQEFQDIFEEERSKMEAIGYRYKPPKELMIPEDPSEDEKIINILLDKKIAAMTQGTNKRETTVTVVSHSADIWIIHRNLFFSQLENNWLSLKELEVMINAKKARREERILEFKNYLTKNVDYISVQKSSLMNKNIVSVIKKKRFTKIEQNNKIIFKEDQNYNSLVRTFKANREEIINPKETAPINTDQGILLPTQPSNFPFPYEEMQEKSSISFNPNEEYLEMFPPPESIESDLKPITPPRPKTSNAPQSHSRAGRGKSEPGNIYNSFFSQLPETKFNKFIARKSKMYVDDQRSKTPSPGPRKVEDNKRRAVTPNVGYNPNTRKGMIIVENPLKGLNYTASLPYEEKKIIDKTVQKGYRICSQDTQISDVLDPEHFLKDRIDIKNNIKQKIENASPPKPKNEEKFFTPAQLKVSDENYVDIFRTTTRLLKMPVHEPKITPRPKPRPSTSIASRTHAANTSASQRLNNCVSKSTNVKKSESRVFEEETSYRIHEIHANRPKSAIQQQEEKGKEKYVINTSIELTPIREDVRFVTDDYFTSKRGNNISPYSGKFEVSRDLASYSEAFSPGSIDKTQAFKETMFNSHKFEKIEKHQESEFKKVTNNRSTSVPQSRAVTPLQMYRQKYAQNVGKTISQSDQAEQTEKPEKPVSEQQISPTKEVINKLAKSQVHHKAPKFFTKHRALSINDSNLFNRVPVVDKSHLLPSRRASDAESVEVFRKKKKKKNFVVEGKRERFSKSVRKVRGH